MERYANIWRHPLYQEHFRLLQEAERERIFCNHTLSHFLDTARLMYLYTLREQTGVPQDLIYAAALLHDIGRYRQIQDGTPHEKAGAELAAQILPECGYSPKETVEICQAILGHRREKEAGAGSNTSAVSGRYAAKEAGMAGTADHPMPAATAPAAAAVLPVSAVGVPAAAGMKIRFSAEEDSARAELLALYLRRADKKSRCCFCCPAASECSWPQEKRNSFPDL